VTPARAAIAVMALLVGACSAPPPPPPPPPRPAPPPVVLDPDAACLKDLADRKVAFETIAPPSAYPGCTIVNPVKVTGDARMDWSRPGTLSCAAAQAIQRFEAEVVQPTALRLLGQAVTRLDQMGTYDCRTRRTPGQPVAATGPAASRGGRLSEHARGQAIDIGGFLLADGSTISVKRDWKAGGPRAEFLRAVARGACDHFSVVLSPNSNALHADHLHLDIGPHRLCSP